MMTKDFGCAPPHGFGKVTTLTTCDIDPHCRKVLKSLHEAVDMKDRIVNHSGVAVHRKTTETETVVIVKEENLHTHTLQAYRPDHIGFGLEDRIKVEVLNELRQVRAKTLQEFESAKCDILSFEFQRL